jgi:hypothetical protein
MKASIVTVRAPGVRSQRQACPRAQRSAAAVTAAARGARRSAGASNAPLASSVQQQQQPSTVDTFKWSAATAVVRARDATVWFSGATDIC